MLPSTAATPTMDAFTSSRRERAETWLESRVRSSHSRCPRHPRARWNSNRANMGMPSFQRLNWLLSHHTSSSLADPKKTEKRSVRQRAGDRRGRNGNIEGKVCGTRHILARNLVTWIRSNYRLMRGRRQSSKAVWSWSCVQRLIPTGERSGLQTHIAATENISLCARIKY